MNPDLISANNVQLRVPKSWQIRPLKSLASFRKGLSILKTDLSDQGVRVISYGQIHDKTNTGVKLADGLLRYIPQELTRGGAGSRLRYGDLVFADTSEDLEGAGNAVFVDTDDEVFAGYHTVICRLHDENVLPKFLAYVVNSEWWRSQVRRHVSGVKVFSITRRILSSTFVQFPAYPEQRRIVQLLDAETTKIDRALNLLERELVTLEQLKKSIIHEAVTKGLDPTVPMKPSGVEWIGDIPMNWEAKKLKFIASFGSGTTPDSDDYSYYDGGDIPWIQSGDLYDTPQIFSTDKNVTAKAVRELSALSVYKAPFVVVAMYGASIGNTSLSIIDACMNQACCYIRATHAADDEYLFYVITSAKLDLMSKAQGGTQPNISQIVLKNQSVPCPPLVEQKRIVEAIEQRVKDLDHAIVIKRSQFNLLRQQRQALIFEYVTGKRRVNEVA